MRRVWLTMMFLLGILVILSGCDDGQLKKKADEGTFHLYYVNKDENELIYDVYEPTDETPQAMLTELMQFLKSDKETEEHLPLLPENVELVTHTINDGTLTLDFNEAYLDMSKTREVLTRAGVVKLFAQLPDINYVKFTIAGKKLKDASGTPISIMNADTFVEYSSDAINNYQYATIKLYFTDKTGTKLIPEEREVHYNSNVPLERVVIEQLMRGPEGEGTYATLPANMTIMGVATDGTDCYVNLDETFINSGYTFGDNSIPIYSIVNSLAEVCQMERIQISINGEKDVIFNDTIDLNQFFKKNPELVAETVEVDEKN